MLIRMLKRQLRSQIARMAKPIPWLLIPLLCAGFILGSCDAFPGMIRNPGSPQPLSTNTPAIVPPNPTPAPEIRLESLDLIQGHSPHSWRVIGKLINEAEFPLGEISVDVTLLGADGSVLDEASTRAIPDALLPEAEALFAVDFESVLGVVDATAVMHAERITRLQRIKGEIQDAFWMINPDGHTVILGQIANPSFSQAKLSDISVLMLDENEKPIGWAHLVASDTSIPARESSPFVAVANESFAPDSLEFFPDMVVDASLPEPDLQFGEPPALQFTDQGVPFFLGSIHNPSSEWLWASGLLILEKQGELVGVSQITPPLPLPPGEAQPFSIQHFWGISAEILASEEAMSALEVQATVEAIATLPQDESIVQLELNILQYEVFGSLVFLHGLITNPSEALIQEPSVYATMRSAGGQLLSAGWETPIEQLEAGAAIEFELSLYLPRNVNPATLEFDVIAFGVDTGESSRP